jgi:bifunctional DNA-binding transcriptional regulator/antitoxin component of YhaV-PrlF toxin-antitoxin module
METTKVVQAQTESKSLRTTIPAGIARQFGLTTESELGWEIQARDNQLVIVVTPIKPNPTVVGRIASSRSRRPREGVEKTRGKGAATDA